MLSLIRWLSRWPLRLLHVVGAALGWLAYALSPTYRGRLRANAGLAGLGKALRHEAIAEAGRMAAEVPWMWLRPADRRGDGWVRWDGAALIDAALDAGKGLVLLTPHLGCFEACAQGYAQRYGARQPITVLYRPARQRWLRELEETARARPGLHTAPAALSGVRQMLRALKRGETIGMLPDQVPPEGLGVWAPFYGQPAYTMTLAARLVQQSGAALLLMWGERMPRGAGYVLHVRPAPALPRQAENEEALQLACATTVNQAMEALISEKPGQYLWGYHRYKTPRKELGA
ncbi:MAG: lysophospholipid acyltransferase family protein [Pseudomonadota bacterium]